MAKILLMEGGQIRPIESSKFKQEAVLLLAAGVSALGYLALDVRRGSGE